MTKKQVDIATIVLASFALIGAFMPMATLDSAFVGVQHIGGISFLAYIFPLCLIVATIFALSGKFKPSYWAYLPLGILGLALAILITIGAHYQVEAFANMSSRVNFFGRQSEELSVGQAANGLGAYLSVISYAGIVFASALGLVTGAFRNSKVTDSIPT